MTFSESGHGLNVQASKTLPELETELSAIQSERTQLWAVLLWLNIIATRKENIPAIMVSHWQTYGRNYYSRHDYEGLEIEKAQAVIDHVKNLLPSLTGKTLQGETILRTDSFTYHDPIDNSVSENQGLRIEFQSGSRIIVRLSGTGTIGATLRIYLEKYSNDVLHRSTSSRKTLDVIQNIMMDILQLATFTGRNEPDVVS